MLSVLVMVAVGEPDGDAALVASFQQGDPSAFDGLFARYRQPIFGYVYGIKQPRSFHLLQLLPSWSVGEVVINGDQRDAFLADPQARITARS